MTVSRAGCGSSLAQRTDDALEMEKPPLCPQRRLVRDTCRPPEGHADGALEYGLGAVYDNRKSACAPKADAPEGSELRNAVSAAKSVLTLPLPSDRLTAFTT
jgi:hypothetical protein